MSRIHPLEGHHQVPVEVERGALARPEVRVVDSLLRHWMKHVVKAEFVVKLIDSLNSNASWGPRNEGTRHRRTQVFRSSRARAGFRRSLPARADGLVAAHNGKSPVVVKHIETETVPIESDCGGRVSNRHGRDGLVGPDAGSHETAERSGAPWIEHHVEVRRIPTLQALDELFRPLYDNEQLSMAPRKKAFGNGVIEKRR
jgi:hypothetical protein